MRRQVRWLGCAVIAAFLGNPCVIAAEISGRVHFKGDLTEMVKVGYEGVTAAGAHITNMAGLTPTGSSGYVWCDTYKPRRTGLTWSAANGLAFSHTNLPIGTYLVYVKYGEEYVDWKVLTVAKLSSKLTTTLAISPSRMGALDVTVSRGPGSYQVLLAPVTEHGASPVRGADLARGFGPAIEAEINGTSVTLNGVRDGGYRLVLRAATKRGNGRDGYVTTYEDLGSWAITVKAGKRLQYTVP